MKKLNENDILETTLSIAEKGYPEAYQFLLNAYEESPSSFGSQTFYFLACLADGPGRLWGGCERRFKRTTGGIARKCWSKQAAM